MKAGRIHSFGPPNAIVIDEIPCPTPEEKELVVRVAAAGVGPWNALIREGKSVAHLPGGSASSGAHLNNFPLSKGLDVTHRRLAEVAAVFSIELTDTLVSDLKGHCGSVETIDEHSSSGGLQSQLLLILQRTHMGQHTEMMMQRRDAHACDLGQIVHTYRFRVVVFNPGDRSRGAIARISQGCNRPKANSRGSA